MSGGKGKRGPSAPLVTTSDEDEPGESQPHPGTCRDRDRGDGGGAGRGNSGVTTPCPSPPTPTTTNTTTTTPPSITNSPSSEHDYALPDPDYDNVSSPGNSSTASGPTYVRQPGFTQHAHEVTVSTSSPPPPPSGTTTTSSSQPTPSPQLSPEGGYTEGGPPGPYTPHPPPGHCSLVSRSKIKKKKTALLAVKDGLKKRDPTPPKTRPKREPLPMRLRALPQSFWQQPNVPHTVSPGTAYPILPPLCAKDGDDVEEEMRPVTPPEEREERDEREERSKEKTVKPPKIPERRIIVANTDLLFKLFEGIEQDKKGNSSSSTLKRGRPRKVVPCTNKTFVSGEDPYLVDCVSEKLFPQLSLENCGKMQTTNNSSYGSNSAMLHVVSINEGGKCINLPSLSVEQNYSQMLSELVMHI